MCYAMSLPVAATISGVDSLRVLEQNLAVARDFRPLSASQAMALRERGRVDAADGRCELFKTSVKYDGVVGRSQHGYPDAAALPA